VLVTGEQPRDDLPHGELLKVLMAVVAAVTSALPLSSAVVAARAAESADA
jgi:pyruvoyl-dependent arginine decarboxylase (PvlArgDC)